MFAALLRALGRGAVAMLSALFMPVLQQIGHGIAWITRWTLIVGFVLGGMYLLIRHYPEVLDSILQIGVVGLLVYLGFRVMVRALRGGGRQERRRN